MYSEYIFRIYIQYHIHSCCKYRLTTPFERSENSFIPFIWFFIHSIMEEEFNNWIWMVEEEGRRGTFYNKSHSSSVNCCQKLMVGSNSLRFKLCRSCMELYSCMFWDMTRLIWRVILDPIMMVLQDNERTRDERKRDEVRERERDERMRERGWRKWMVNIVMDVNEKGWKDVPSHSNLFSYLFPVLLPLFLCFLKLNILESYLDWKDKQTFHFWSSAWSATSFLPLSLFKKTSFHFLRKLSLLLLSKNSFSHFSSSFRPFFFILSSEGILDSHKIITMKIERIPALDGLLIVAGIELGKIQDSRVIVWS